MIRPVSDLRNNFADISRTVHETGEPVFLTKNGYGDMVVLSMEAYENLRLESEIYFKLLEAERDKLNGEQSALVKEHSELYALCQTLAAELQRAKREAGQLRSKLNDASDALQAGLYPAAVKHLLSAAKLKRLDADPRAVVDAFTAPASLAAALEAYLGGRQFLLLVEDMEEAGRCINRLKQNAAGVASFLPLERARPRYPNKAYRRFTRKD